MKTLFTALLISAAVTTANAWTPSPGFPVCSVVLPSSDGFSAMRDGPSVVYPMLTQLYPGDIVFEAEYVGGWMHIDYTLRRGPVSGWVHGSRTRQVPCPAVAAPRPPVVVASPPVAVVPPPPVVVQPAPVYIPPPITQQQQTTTFNPTFNITTPPPVVSNNNNNN
jgi:hypothetical protein